MSSIVGNLRPLARPKLSICFDDYVLSLAVLDIPAVYGRALTAGGGRTLLP